MPIKYYQSDDGGMEVRLNITAKQTEILEVFDSSAGRRKHSLADIFVAGAEYLLTNDRIEPPLTREEERDADAAMSRSNLTPGGVIDSRLRYGG